MSATENRNPTEGPVVRCVDLHTAGEPFRIIVDGAPETVGETVAERRAYALESDEVQEFRRLVCHEPRGHADMYGGILVEPDDDGAQIGVLFWHKDGFSTACGHGTIALGVWAVEEGIVPPDDDGVAVVSIDVPSGRVDARVVCDAGVPQSVIFRNVPAYVMSRDVELELGSGRVTVDISFGGAVYVSVRAADLGLAVEPAQVDALIAAGREIKAALKDSELTRHPSDDRLSGVYGVMIYDELGDDELGPRQRNVTIFADGQVDRSPCGSGTSARIALLAAEGRMAEESVFRNLSIIDGEFHGRIVEATTADGHDALITDVEGMAYRTGSSEFVLDPRDPIGIGFVLR
ncbi:MAG: proline racemase family protein [Solirubrobacterales bacterium]